MTQPARDWRWTAYQMLGLALTAALLLAVFENTRLDVLLELPFYDAALHDFPLRTHWFFSGVMHHGLKMTSYALGVVALGGCLYALRGQIDWLPPRHALLAACGMLLVPLVISSLKHFTNRHCPWDVVDFGGFAPYVSLFSSNPPDIKPGACFPAGHSAAGLAWLAWAFALAGLDRRRSRLALVAALAFGIVLGFGRMLQGAHFLSHTLWSVWFAWAICTVLAFLLRVPMRPQPVVAAVSQPDSALPTISATSGESPSVRDTRSSAARIDT